MVLKLLLKKEPSEPQIPYRIKKIKSIPVPTSKVSGPGGISPQMGSELFIATLENEFAGVSGTQVLLKGERKNANHDCNVAIRKE